MKITLYILLNYIIANAIFIQYMRTTSKAFYTEYNRLTKIETLILYTIGYAPLFVYVYITESKPYQTLKNIGSKL